MTLRLVMKGEGERNKTEEKQVMHIRVSHHLLTKAQPVPK